jgi:hypothetical protein
MSNFVITWALPFQQNTDALSKKLKMHALIIWFAFHPSYMESLAKKEKNPECCENCISIKFPLFTVGFTDYIRNRSLEIYLMWTTDVRICKLELEIFHLSRISRRSLSLLKISSAQSLDNIHIISWDGYTADFKIILYMVSQKNGFHRIFVVLQHPLKWKFQISFLDEITIICVVLHVTYWRLTNQITNCWRDLYRWKFRVEFLYIYQV